MRLRFWAIGALLLVPARVHTAFAAETPQPVKVYRIGVLTVDAPELLRQSLRDLGYIEGQNCVLDIRDTMGRSERG